MGVHILLFVQREKVSPDVWERIYTESLVLLRNFPAPLMRLKVERIDGEERYCFTSEIVRDGGTSEERWIVEGDVESRARAERFELYRSHDRQFPRWGFGADGMQNSRDVLWADPTENPYDLRGNGFMVWESKTQGRPYHYAMLAVGMLVESRCPGCAYVTGDIDLSAAEVVRQWANPLLDEPLSLPISVDPDRLYRRLSEVYDDERNVITRARGLFRGTDSELHRAVIRNSGGAAAEALFRERLEEFDSFAALGASELVAAFLEATGDVARLIEIAAEVAAARRQEGADGADGDGERFSLNRLLEGLCSRFITIPPEERGVLGADDAGPGAAGLATSDEVIADLFLKMTAASSLPVHVAADDLLEAFSRAAPEERDRFAETIRNGERKCRETLERVQDAVGEFDGLSDATERFSGPASGSATAGSAAPDADRSDGAEAIRAEIARQTVHYSGVEDATREIGALIRSKLMSTPVVATPQTRSELLGELYRVTRENGIGLTESAWNEIDALEDEAMLRHLLAMAAVKNHEMHFCDQRLYLLENPRLWRLLAGGR